MRLPRRRQLTRQSGTESIVSQPSISHAVTHTTQCYRLLRKKMTSSPLTGLFSFRSHETSIAKMRNGRESTQYLMIVGSLAWGQPIDFFSSRGGCSSRCPLVCLF